MDRSQHVVRSVFDGFRFGMLLQVAVGPMCLMVFHTSATYGIAYGLIVMLSVALVDAIFIALASVGIAAFISKPSVKTVFKFLGGAVLILFGVSMIAEAFETFAFAEHSALCKCVEPKSLFAGFLSYRFEPYHNTFLERTVLDPHGRRQLG